MLNKALEILKKLEEKGFSAYIVGGYVRDSILEKNSNDIDICTSATPKEIIEIFPNSKVNDNQYGSIEINYKNNYFDITTYRKDIKYENNRIPVKIKYIKDIKTDLLRRDFTINTLCINSKNEVIDLLNAKKDIQNRIIKTVGNPKYKLREDSLRILRAIRFATLLDFKIDVRTKKNLKKYGHLLQKLSFTRKKDELEKIFLSSNKEKGIALLLELNLAKYLSLDNLSEIKICDHIIGIWAQLNVDNLYPFNKIEKEQMVKIRILLELDIYDPYNIYMNGLYISTIVADIKGIDKTELNRIQSKIKIHNMGDINIKQIDIANILNKEPGRYLKAIIQDIEKEIVYNRLNNNYDDIKTYILQKYN